MELKDTLKRGDILVRQYGYNMTLYEFYQVYAIKGNKVDLFYPSYNDCMQFGRRSVKVYILE